MCGISGIMAPGGASDAQLQRSIEALAHRGPDDTGRWVDAAKGIAFAHVRLSIVDLSAAGHQPMESRSGRYVLTFNGEIYNHAQLRAELTGTAGWRGRSDTETILAGFEAWGVEATIKRAVGMFAFAVWDNRESALTLGRDRLGEKPLYYGRHGGQFIFASELRALSAYNAFEPRVDRDALASYIRYGYVPAPFSIYEGIFKLPAGTLLTVRPGAHDTPRPRPYWSLLEVAQQGMENPFSGTDSDAIAELERLLNEAIALQRVADVPLGVFLSGGVDSSLVTALMQAQSRIPVRTFTIGFDEGPYDESAHARAVARHLGTDHTEMRLTSDDALAVVERLPQIYDEPFADASQIPTFLVSQMARRNVTVSLSGDGGDELFAGYNRYGAVRRLLGIPGPVRRMIAAGLSFPSQRAWNRAFEALTPVMPRRWRLRFPGDKAHKLAAVLTLGTEQQMYRRLTSVWTDPDAVVVGGRDTSGIVDVWDIPNRIATPEHRMMAQDAVSYLPDDILCKVDRAAMAVALETRVPFLDHRVVEFAWRLPLGMKQRGGRGKWILREMLARRVPRELIDRPKMGFAAPLDRWLRGPLRPWAEELLSVDRLRADGYFDVARVRNKWAEHLSGRNDVQYQLWNVLMFQAWLTQYQPAAELAHR